MKAYSVPGFSTNKDLDIVYEWARTVPENGVIVEVGTFMGRTAVAFAEGAPASAKIYCIDYYNDWTCNIQPDDAPGGDFWEIGKVYSKQEKFSQFTKDYPNIIPLKLNYHEKCYPYNKEPIDVLFIDALHRNPDDILNIVYLKGFVKNGGMICGHDYYDDNRFPDVGKNINFLEKTFQTTVTLYKFSSMWSIRIKE